MSKNKLPILLLLTLLVGCKPNEVSSSQNSEGEGSVSESEVSATPSSTPNSIPSSEASTTFPATPVGIEVPDTVFTYYTSVNFALTKNNLKEELFNKIKGHTSFNYSQVRDNMYITDRDWKLSPNRSESNPYMVLIYGQYNHSSSTAYKFLDMFSGASQFNGEQMWDREHIWAKSHGGFTESSIAGTDMHHLRASDKGINNNARGNLDFGNVVSGAATIRDFDNNASGKTGYSSLGSSAKVYEPADEFKGDIARAIFYMATRYSSFNTTGSSDNRNFEVVNALTSKNNNPKLGILNDLLAWHLEDPVDEFEFNRNGLVQDLQKNRNPYIDFPELAQKVFG